MPERVAGKQVEKLKRSRRAGGRSAEGKGIEGQAGTVREETAGEKTTMLMEEVCAHERT